MTENSEKEFQKTNINWFPGHMQKTKRLIKEKYDLIDVVYELVDARIPFSSKIRDIDELIKNKPRIMIMTKKDLCDIYYTEQWVKYYENKGYRVLLADLNKGDVIKQLVDITHDIMKPIQEKRVLKGLMNKEIKVLVLGIPNVGKSTLINKMVGKKVAVVGNKPGVTKSLSWLKTNSDILLLDTPGILWPKFDNQDVALNLASMSAIKSEILNEDDVACHILKKLNDYYPDVLRNRFKISTVGDDFDIMDAYETIGKSIGAIKQGEVDYSRVSNRIINDLKNEYIKEVTFDNEI